MPILTNVQHDFYSEETDAESPVSTQLMQKIGENFNFLNDLTGKFESFTSSDTWQVPEGVERIYIFASGGGGGGQGSNLGSPGIGGGGCVPYLAIANTTPLETLTITIGAGGSAGGPNNTPVAGTGGTTSVVTAARTLTFLGADLQAAVDGNRTNNLIGLLFTPQQRSNVYADAGANNSGNGGGAGFLDGGAGGAASGNGSSAAANSGAGGGGGGSGTTSGGAGGSGFCFIIY